MAFEFVKQGIELAKGFMPDFLKEALEASKDKSIKEKISIIASSFMEKLASLFSKGEEVKKKTDAELAEAVKKYKEPVVKALKIDTKDLEGEEKKAADALPTHIAVGIAPLPKEARENAQNALKKLRTEVEKGDEAMDPDTEVDDELEFEEATAFAAVSFGTLASIARKYENKKDFMKALKTYEKVTGESAFPLEATVWSLQRLMANIDTDIGKAISLAGRLNIDVGSATSLATLKEEPDAEIPEDALKIFREKIFPETADGDVADAVRAIRKIRSAGKTEALYEALAELATTVKGDDFRRLAFVLSGGEAEKFKAKKAPKKSS